MFSFVGSACFLLIALLLASVRVVVTTPIPAHLQPGDIVHVAPQDTDGWQGTGAATPHPHIYMGQEGGKSVLAPVSHTTNPNFGPHMDATTLGHSFLEGSVGLKHVTANQGVNLQQPAQGRWANAHVSQSAVQRIQGGKDLVKAHTEASAEHSQAAGAHSGARAAHLLTSAAQQFKAGAKPAGSSEQKVLNAMGRYHQRQANKHTPKIKEHNAGAAVHSGLASAVTGPDQHSLAFAQAAKAAATASKDAAHASKNRATGNHP